MINTAAACADRSGSSDSSLNALSSLSAPFCVFIHFSMFSWVGLSHADSRKQRPRSPELATNMAAAYRGARRRVIRSARCLAWPRLALVCGLCGHALASPRSDPDRGTIGVHRRDDGDRDLDRSRPRCDRPGSAVVPLSRRDRGVRSLRCAPRSPRCRHRRDHAGRHDPRQRARRRRGCRVRLALQRSRRRSASSCAARRARRSSRIATRSPITRSAAASARTPSASARASGSPTRSTSGSASTATRPISICTTRATRRSSAVMAPAASTAIATARRAASKIHSRPSTTTSTCRPRCSRRRT